MEIVELGAILAVYQEKKRKKAPEVDLNTCFSFIARLSCPLASTRTRERLGAQGGLSLLHQEIIGTHRQTKGAQMPPKHQDTILHASSSRKAISTRTLL